VDVAGLRDRLGLSQSEFARAFGVDLGALQAGSSTGGGRIVQHGFCWR
jgi:transcriptional regulator with XRE-family HTH domain